MGAPSDQFLHLLWRPPYVFFFILYGGPWIISLHTILEPQDHFLRLLYGAPQICFFSYNMEALLRSVSLFTMWDPPPPSDQFLCMLYGVPSDQLILCILFRGPSQISFFSCYMGLLSDQFFLLLYGPPSDQFLRILYGGPLRSVSSPTIWGSPEISFFAYYMRAPLRSVSSLTIWGPH